MFTGMEMMACQNLAVPAEVMQHVVNVESAHNPYAIGVVGAQLVRQPRNLRRGAGHRADARGQAATTFQWGWPRSTAPTSGKYGLDSYEKAFDACPNLAAGARILAECHASCGGDWGKSFSCYYSGNFATGYPHGYVQKVYASISRERAYLACRHHGHAAIPLRPNTQVTRARNRRSRHRPRPAAPAI